MKKLFLFAATAMLFAACTSEDVVAPQTGQLTADDGAVGFDVYVPGATAQTRAGLEGTMTTNRLQRSEAQGGGFGVYAYQVQDADNTTAADKYDPSSPGSPNFMANEKLLWNATNQGWYYNPLKYWPNETDNDSQNSAAEMYGIGTSTKHLDRLTFFAYAPYVEKGDASKPGITYITNQNGKLTTGTDVTGTSYPAESVKEASIGYMAAIDNPNEAVDLLWGVAPSGGLEYTAVNGQSVKIEEGMPLIDMTKPNVNTSMKFLFQHALARIGVTAVAAIDQVGAGGTLDPNTKITINKITLTGYFGKTGILNLDNSNPSVAKWVEVNGKVISSTAFGSLGTTTLTLQANQTDPEDGTIATHLQFIGTSTGASGASATPVAQTDRSGVTTIKQSVIQPALINNAAGKNRNWYTMKHYNDNELAYSETTPYYTNEDCSTQATVSMPKSVKINDKGQYVVVDANPSFKYPQVLENYKFTETMDPFTAVTASNMATYADYNAYSNYKPLNKTITTLKDENTAAGGDDAAFDAKNYYAYINANDGYKKITHNGTYDYITYGYKEAYTKLADGKYIPAAGAPKNGDFVVEGIKFYQVTDPVLDYYADYQPYEWDGTNKLFNPLAAGTIPVGGKYVICGQLEKIIPYYDGGDYYKRDANYFMVVPTNNFVDLHSYSSAEEEQLRTVRVMIEYYITTEDGKLGAGRAQTKNVIEKDVVFPSLANGKSYNLNLVLGLTSVKMEAEVDDWKVINVQADLPQNTAGE